MNIKATCWAIVLATFPVHAPFAQSGRQGQY